MTVIQGIIQRRILVNYQVDLDVLSRHIPPPFRPKAVQGVGIAGICLIGLKHIRPQFVPVHAGLGSENAAHRVAVEWLENGVRREGVYVFRRDSSSRINELSGGRLFPGVYHHAKFDVLESEPDFAVRLTSDDGQTHVTIQGHLSQRLPETSVFSSLDQASAFFEAGSVGYSETRTGGQYDGIELRNAVWNVEPLEITKVESSFYGDPSLFPPGSVKFDSALIMRDVPHEWHVCGAPARPAVHSLA